MLSLFCHIRAFEDPLHARRAHVDASTIDRCSTLAVQASTCVSGTHMHVPCNQWADGLHASRSASLNMRVRIRVLQCCVEADVRHAVGLLLACLQGAAMVDLLACLLTSRHSANRTPSCCC